MLKCRHLFPSDSGEFAHGNLDRLVGSNRGIFRLLRENLKIFDLVTQPGIFFYLNRREPSKIHAAERISAPVSAFWKYLNLISPRVGK